MDKKQIFTATVASVAAALVLACGSPRGGDDCDDDDSMGRVVQMLDDCDDD